MKDWNRFDKDNRPPAGEMVEVIFADGVQCQAKVQGRLGFPDGGDMYRYVDISFWRPLEKESPQ